MKGEKRKREKMINSLKIENGCSSAEDFKQRAKVGKPGNVFLKVPVQNGFYLQFADSTNFKMESVSFTVSLCHEDCSEKVPAFTVRLAGELQYSLNVTVVMDVEMIFLESYSWMLKEYTKEFFNIRESLSDIAVWWRVKKGTYKGIPQELKPFQYWLSGRGNVVMAILECLLEKAEADGNLYSYEVGIPCSYVLEKGYRFHKGHVVVDAPYDPEYGLDIPESYDCW